MTGPKTGSTEVFIDNLPGMPDNIRPSRDGGYWVGMAFANGRRGLLSMDLIAPYPWLKRFIAKVGLIRSAEFYISIHRLLW